MCIRDRCYRGSTVLVTVIICMLANTVCIQNKYNKFIYSIFFNYRLHYQINMTTKSHGIEGNMPQIKVIFFCYVVKELTVFLQMSSLHSTQQKAHAHMDVVI